jgi:hypothetical protein
MNKKALIWIIVAAVAVIAIIWIIVAAVNNGNNQNGGNGGNGGANGGLNASTEITDTSVQGERIEGSSLIVTKLTPGSSRGAKLTVVNAGDSVQNHMARATFYNAAGEELASGSFTVASLEPGETKEATLLILSNDWKDYASVKYAVSEPSSAPGQ